MIMQVVAINEDSVELQGERQSSCKSCAQKSSCINVATEDGGLFSARLAKQPSMVVGQHLNVSCQDSFLLKVIAVMLLPSLAGLVGGALLVSYSFASYVTDWQHHDGQNTLAGLGALAGFSLGVIVSRRLTRHLAGKARQQVSVSKLKSKEPQFRELQSMSQSRH
ncbi:SoxR reducing system RseC family protein [Agarivorans sp. TSD2052]|uniref:SoxR reducing system RseC family protein n=1 Tax=Agarivorans sp. TSD2052 TaxID=2937286 RepID=UPI00200F9103|nr:SoxR reducing system RseC family protein [Agarivorans sp. TSD2052]UPW20707.1 SoxR reducing system RseC family protein [Agarivorans sp. TSD2052]